MAVYTQIEFSDLQKLLNDFDIGEVSAFHGIESGIENTNYFVDTLKNGSIQQYVLTLFEELPMEDMPFFVELGHWLAKAGIPIPYAIKDTNGIALKTVKSKPALIQPRYYGKDVAAQDLQATHCQQIGEALAQFHLAGQDFFMQRQAHRGVIWWRRESEAIAHLLPAPDALLLKAEVKAFDEFRSQSHDLPQGVIHGDLFHDNALFKDNKLDAILDMYNAANAYWLYDLAIVANDWCSFADGSIDAQREQALLQGYASIRSFTSAEREAWPLLTRTAAMRFWLSRLIPWLGVKQTFRQGIDMKLKDPEQYKKILQHRIAHPPKISQV